MKLGVLASHPVQYQAPWFRGLAKELKLEVFFCHRQSAEEQGKAGFGVAFDWDVDLLSGYAHCFLKNIATRPGVNHFGGCDTPEIREVIRSGEFGAFIVSGWYLKSYWQAVWACRHLGVPVLVRGDSQLHTPRSMFRRWVKEILYRPLLRQFDGFLAVGKRNREYLAHYGVPERKMFFVPHFVDNEWFSKKAESGKWKAEIRKSWGASERDFVALFVGKFIPKKRPADLLRALGVLNRQQTTINFVAVFVGSGELENELREMAARENVQTHFAGFKNQSELPACYAAADVLVLPSDIETWGLVVNEAMACELPAIVSEAVGCAPDLIEEGRTGFTFPVGDVEQLADRLVGVARLRGEGFDFSSALRDKTAAYSLEAAVERTFRAVNTFVKNCPRPAETPR
jgi:glycosyltransferase involved in cell wall biosynthesis